MTIKWHKPPTWAIDKRADSSNMNICTPNKHRLRLVDRKGAPRARLPIARAVTHNSKNINGQTIVLHRDNLASGVHFVWLTEEKKTIAVDKLVITDK